MSQEAGGTSKHACKPKFTQHGCIPQCAAARDWHSMGGTASVPSHYSFGAERPRDAPFPKTAFLSGLRVMPWPKFAINAGWC